jgi:voltage-gated potassium channel
MHSAASKIADHIIVAGVGSVGQHVVEELHAAGVPLVVIDRSEPRIQRVAREVGAGELLYVVGDATEDDTLIAAGVTRCRGVVAALTEDKDNLFVTLSARSLNASARIVAKVIEPDAEAKMRRAGADETVSPNIIGGRRLAREIVRPTLIAFLEELLKERQQPMRLEEVPVPPRSPYAGRPLGELPTTGDAAVLVIAVRLEDKFVYNPDPSHELAPGSVLIVLGEGSGVEALRGVMAG